MASTLKLFTVVIFFVWAGERTWNLFDFHLFSLASMLITQHNDTQHNDIQHNDTQHKDTQYNDPQLNDIQNNNTP